MTVSRTSYTPALTLKNKKISTSVNAQDWQQKNDHARAVDQSELLERLAGLEANQAKLMEILST
jgi:hypothetical protein